MHDAGVGDFILASGAIREIRRLYPTARITLVVYPRSMALAELCPYVDEVIGNARICNSWEILLSYYSWNLQFARQLLERQFDICYAFAHYPDTLFLMYMSGAKTRITYDFDSASNTSDISLKEAANLANIKLQGTNYRKHAVDMCFALIDNILNAPVANREIEFWYSPAEIVWAKDILKNFPKKIYGMCMGGSALKKHYPPEMYVKVISMILEVEPNATFVILGDGNNELMYAEILKKNINEKYHKNILSFVGKINYRQSGVLLKFCDMYIGNDTGVMHLATAVKCPVLTPNCFPSDISFSDSDIPKTYSPYKVPSVIIMPKHALQECSDDIEHDGYGCKSDRPHCITQIKPETIFKAFKILKKRIAENNIEPMYFS